MKKLSKIAGITLIEMLIGIAVSSIMIAAMYSSYTIINSSYSRVTDVASISRSGRDIVAMLMRDIRMAGYKYYYGYNSENEALPDDQRIPRQDYLEYKPGDTAATKSETHKPIVILRGKLNYETETDPAEAPAGYDTISLDQRHEPKQGEPLHLCCDIIQIIYGDFDLSDRDQPYKKYRITYFARPLKKSGDQYYGVYRSQEYWSQTLDQTEGRWIDNGDECKGTCYPGELIREYLYDMSFVAIGEHGQIISADPTITGEDNAGKRIEDIRSIDETLTFRSGSKKGFFNKIAAAAEPRIIKSLGRKAQPFFDRFLRDSVFVTVHTRNIGNSF